MQSGGGQQYGVPEFVVQRPPQATHMFAALSHEMSLSPTTHLHLQQQHQQHQQHHQQQQQQHHHQQHQQHHHHQAQQHAPHSQLQPLAQHQPPPPPQQHAQHPHQQQHAQHQQQHQQAMVQQLGLGPESPEVPSPVASRPSPTGFKQRESMGEDEGGEDEGRGTGGNRWPRQETLALIKIRSEMDANFRDSGLKGPLWEDVSRKLAELGYQRSSKKCKEKFENVHKYYKKTKDGRAGRQDGKNYRFFSQLEALYGGAGGGGGGGGGSSSQHGDGGSLMLTTGVSSVAIGAGTEGNLSLQRPAENSSGVNVSSDSEDDYYDPGDNEEGEKSKKRKRKEGKMLSKMLYFESLLKKLVEKQEAMQRKFLDAIERREQERLAREEAWKRQEMARTNREHELRAQEHALAATRDAALVAFLQKVTGQTLTLPPRAPPQALTVVAPEAHQVEDLSIQEKESFDPNSKRWPKAEVQALIRLRSQMEPRFQEAGPKGPLWEEICTGMACLGYSRNAKRCKEKWENINKYFRKTKETNKKRPDNAKTCPYFHQLAMLYRKGVLGTPSSKMNKLDDNSDDLLEHPSTRGDNSDHDHGAEEILAMMPAGDGPSGASTSNGGATQFFSSPGNGSSGDRGSKKVMKQQEIIASPSNGDRASASVLELNFDGLHRGDGENFSGNGGDKSVRLEGLVSSMLEQQQHEEQEEEQQGEQKVPFKEGTFVGRREQEREMREYERRQQEDYRFSQERARVSSRDTTLIALVQKLTAGESSEFALTTAAGSE